MFCVGLQSKLVGDADPAKQLAKTEICICALLENVGGVAGVNPQGVAFSTSRVVTAC